MASLGSVPASRNNHINGWASAAAWVINRWVSAPWVINRWVSAPWVRVSAPWVRSNHITRWSSAAWAINRWVSAAWVRVMVVCSLGDQSLGVCGLDVRPGWVSGLDGCLRLGGMPHYLTAINIQPARWAAELSQGEFAPYRVMGWGSLLGVIAAPLRSLESQSV